MKKSRTVVTAINTNRSWLVVVLLCILLLTTAVISAQTTDVPTGNGFRISPVRSEFIIEKGESKSFTITLDNPSNSLLRAKPVVNDFIASEDESGEPRLILDPDTVLPANDFRSLVSPIDEIELKGRERKDINVTITVPKHANAGGYYGAIRFVPVLANEDGTNVALTASVGSIVLVQVPGELTQRLDLVELTSAQLNDKDEATPRGFIIGGGIHVLTRLKNSGNIHVKPFGKVIIEDFFGKTVHEYEFNNTDLKANVLPDSIRRFVDELPDKKWLGRYTIKMNLTYGTGGGDLISAQTSFWYFPTLIFYLLILLLIMLAVGINLLIYRIKKQRK
jgi:hypothetical protein